ncbi:hypothetical protein BDZ89DRAFT_987386 [Hymenopellis radicata]|nr:hypothetical protein BDZ89DRAFT_987386 [Hymenopellis radicata]
MSAESVDMMVVNLVDASLAGICVESLLYGICVVLFSASTYLHALRHSRGAKPGQRTSRYLKPATGPMWTPIFIGTIVAFLAVTGQWISSVLRLFQAFRLYDDGNSPLEFYADRSQPSNIVKMTFILVALLVCDVMLIYRLWVVWNFNRLVMSVPSLTIVGMTASAIGIIYNISRSVHGPVTDIFTSAAGQWIIGDIVFTFSTTMYCTAMITYRIWSINRLVEGSGGGLNSVMALIAESAALYAVWTLFFLITFLSQSSLEVFCLDTIGHVSTIATLLINVRVGLGWAQTAFDPTALTTVTGLVAQEQHELSTATTVRMDIDVTRVVDYPNEFDGDESVHDDFSPKATGGHISHLPFHVRDGSETE